MAGLIVEGLSNPEIAGAMDLQPATVSGYVKEIYRRTGAPNRVRLVLALRRAEGPRQQHEMMRLP